MAHFKVTEKEMREMFVHLRGYREFRGEEVHPGQERRTKSSPRPAGREAGQGAGRLLSWYILQGDFSQFLMLNNSAESESGD